MTHPVITIDRETRLRIRRHNWKQADAIHYSLPLPRKEAKALAQLVWNFDYLPIVIKGDYPVSLSPAKQLQISILFEDWALAGNPQAETLRPYLKQLFQSDLQRLDLWQTVGGAGITVFTKATYPFLNAHEAPELRVLKRMELLSEPKDPILRSCGRALAKHAENPDHDPVFRKTVDFTKGLRAAPTDTNGKKLIEFATKPIEGKSQSPLVLLSAQLDLKVLIGGMVKIGILMDPNTQLEYMYFEFEVSAGLGVGGGFSAGIEALDNSPHELSRVSSSFSASANIELGPVVISFKFAKSRPKIPVVEWQGIPKVLPFEIDGDDLLSVEGDTETGERVKKGTLSDRLTNAMETKKKEPKNTKAKTAAQFLSIPIAKVDTGPVVIDCVLKPSASGKVKVALGPEYKWGYKKVLPMDMDFGWFEDAMYDLMQAYLPKLDSNKQPKLYGY